MDTDHQAVVDPRSLGMDVDRVAPKLYVGAYVDNDALIARAGFSDVVRVARECPKVEYPMDDGALDDGGYGMAMRAAAEVCRALARGGRVLVTCAMGVNRSAFVAALAMVRYYGLPPRDAICQVQAYRHPSRPGAPPVLSNQYFVKALMDTIPSRSTPSHLRLVK